MGTTTSGVQRGFFEVLNNRAAAPTKRKSVGKQFT